jgi:hypothetical protein
LDGFKKAFEPELVISSEQMGLPVDGSIEAKRGSERIPNAFTHLPELSDITRRYFWFNE